ncbi:hypothetical protein [Polaribacter ponticola]|uniref:RiboL-PSP-HEPN domain-containing protein n=1 Tax=Polaribacter ponticola TaxID=2978475 RepID=A0ABT5S7I6_9FLAO|nr:hypothetical protein [Polaribacter sp. MSW5]MDD7914061.1 hypothetical protein [Polaribacter sp. MSW5]
MTKSKAKKEIERQYSLFWNGSFNAFSLNSDLEGSLKYLKLENEIAIKRHISNSGLTEKQIIASEGYLRDELKKIDQYPKTITPMILVYLTSTFEIFLKSIIRILLKFNPEPIKNNDKKIPLQTILASSDLDELLDLILEQITHDLGYKNISEQISYLNTKININLSFKKLKGLIANRRFINIEEIQEIFLIRNLVLHNGGIVNKQYLNLTNRQEYKEGEKIEVTKDDIQNYFTTIFHGTSAISRQSKLYIKEFKTK